MAGWPLQPGQVNRAKADMLRPKCKQTCSSTMLAPAAAACRTSCSALSLFDALSATHENCVHATVTGLTIWERHFCATINCCFPID